MRFIMEADDGGVRKTPSSEIDPSHDENEHCNGWFTVHFAMKALFALGIAGATVFAANCSSSGLTSMLNYFKNVPMSRPCLQAGPWNSTAKPIDFLSFLRDYIPLACSQSACRTDFDTAVSNFQNIRCDEAQALSLSLDGVRKICLSLSVTSPTAARCGPNDYLDLGALTSQCYGLVPTAAGLLDLVMPADLSTYTMTCNSSCVTSMLNRINTLPDCATDWQYFGGAPMSTKAVYKTFVNAMCGYDLCYYWWNGNVSYLCSWGAPYNDFTSCSAQLASLFATPFSTTCSNAVFNSSMAYILQTTTQGNYLLQSHLLSTDLSCMADVATLQARMTNGCSLSLLSALQILQSVWQTPVSSPNVMICNASATSTLTTLLNSPPSSSCMNLGVAVSTWLDVLLPSRLLNLLTIAASPTCVSAALSFVNTFPSCEWIDDTGLSMGINASSRFSSFLVAAASTIAVPPSLPTTISPTSCSRQSMQATFSYYRNVTLSSACLKFGPWNATTRPIDFLTSLQSYIPLACSQSACRADFQTSASNLGSIYCDESRSLADGMNRIVSICKALTVATTTRMCTDSDSLDLGSLPAQCFASIVAPRTPTVLDLFFPSNMTAINGTCYTDCATALFNRISTLPDCQVEWPAFAGAPVAPKSLYKTYLNALCGYDMCTNYWWYGYSPYLCGWSAPYNDFSSCSAVTASLYSTPFSKTCNQAYRNTFVNQTNETAGMYIVETALTGNYLVKSRFLASVTACILDVVALAYKANCSSTVSFALQTLQVVWSTIYKSTANLPSCNQSNITTLLNAAPPYSCISLGLTSWSQVFLPSHMSDLSSLSQACVTAALEYAKTFPACEWIDLSAGESLVGINVSTRVSSFLVAAQSVLQNSSNLTKTPSNYTPSTTYYYPSPSPNYYYPPPYTYYTPSTYTPPTSTASYKTPTPSNSSSTNSSTSPPTTTSQSPPPSPSSSPPQSPQPSSTSPASTSCLSSDKSAMFAYFQSLPLSSTCLSFGPWNQTAKPTDFLTTLQPFIPFACFQSSCRADIAASVTNFKKMACDEAQLLGAALDGLVSLCQRLSLSFSLSTCTVPPDIGSMTVQCFDIIPGTTSLLDLIEPSSLLTYNSICNSSDCVASIATRIGGLSDCQVDWPTAGSAPISPKILYSSFLSGMCSLPVSTTIDYGMCPGQLAALYTTPFSLACIAALGGKQYVLETAFMGDYVHQIQKIALNSACMGDIAVMKARLATLNGCASGLVFASEVLQKVLATSHSANTSLPLCTKTQFAAGTTLLASPASASCYTNTTKVVSWSDVLLPSHLADLVSFVNKTDCIEAALAVAKNLPPCEWADPTRGDIVTGVDATTRVSSFLVAIKSLAQTTASTSTAWKIVTSSPLLFLALFFSQALE
ncbi:hypothetical protein LEN26_005077 [Aphanomyces euteiches]|nr:hypothetical protein LEN26_005077 [Aphanomyces euteiches]